jgi:hypothetical protein
VIINNSININKTNNHLPPVLPEQTRPWHLTLEILICQIKIFYLRLITIRHVILVKDAWVLLSTCRYILEYALDVYVHESLTVWKSNYRADGFSTKKNHHKWTQFWKWLFSNILLFYLDVVWFGRWPEPWNFKTSHFRIL